MAQRPSDTHPSASQRVDPRTWQHEAIRRIEADFQRSSDTHLIALPAPGLPGVDLYLKDESSHPTGSLKHRLARSLFLHALCNGWLHEGSTVVEASSGSTAISEAYFARLLGLPFWAVMPRSTSPDKIAAIEFAGGQCHLVEHAADIYQAAATLAAERGGHYMDQFTFAERATDWRANNNIAESIYHQLEREAHPCPRWIIASAGTGGTLATIGRYVRYRRFATQVCGVDAERSVFFDHYLDRNPALSCAHGSRIEGIGRPRVEASFVPGVLDAMVQVRDVWSIAAARALAQVLGRPVGGSTGTNLMAALHCAQRMVQAGERGSIVTLLCDSGERYRQSYYHDAWLADQGLSCAAEQAVVYGHLQTGQGLNDPPQASAEQAEIFVWGRAAGV
jgi:cysteine synthase